MQTLATIAIGSVSVAETEIDPGGEIRQRAVHMHGGHRQRSRDLASRYSKF